MRTLISFTALFLSVSFVQLGSGSLAPLDALAGAAHGFSTADIGLFGSSHFIGFFIGCWLCPRLIGSIGHSRAFAAIASIGAVAALSHPIIISPTAWAVFRVGTGFAVAGCFTVVESWMQAKVDNSNRGRVLGVYRVVDMLSSVASQGLVALLDPTSFVAYNIVAMFCCLCLLPLAVTRRKAPPSPRAPRLRPLKTIMLSPLGAAGVVVTGLTSASFRMVGPVYGIEAGLDAAGVALFLAVAILGGASAQIPMGWLADRYDRRWVLIGVSAAACGVCGVLAGAGAQSGAWLYAGSFLFGMATFPLFSVSAAHANDFSTPEQAVELNASLMMLFGIGAIVSPVAAAAMIDSYGPSGLFAYIGGAHVFLILFGAYRMSRRPTPERRAGYQYLPRTTFTFGRFFRWRQR